MTHPVKMIDVSGWQHLGNQPIDWHAVKRSGVEAVMVKATEGTDFVSPWAATDGNGARAAGLKIGYYHFAHPGRNGAQEEAAYFLAHIAGLPRSIGGALDLEVTEGVSWADLSAWAQTFLDEVHKVCVYTSLYTNGYFLSNLAGAPWGHLLWYANPTQAPRFRVWAWQYSWTGEVPGVPAPCDLDQVWL
jgi:GH25 family lysozyme M1 (1,4-beta-N-acetylmuramidase)